MKKEKHQPTTKDWAKGIIAILLYLAFLYWVGSWWGLIVVPFIFDAYITRLIPWTWWKEAENSSRTTPYPAVLLKKAYWLATICS